MVRSRSSWHSHRLLTLYLTLRVCGIIWSKQSPFTLQLWNYWLQRGKDFCLRLSWVSIMLLLLRGRRHFWRRNRSYRVNDCLWWQISFWWIVPPHRGSSSQKIFFKSPCLSYFPSLLDLYFMCMLLFCCCKWNSSLTIKKTPSPYLCITCG